MTQRRKKTPKAFKAMALYRGERVLDVAMVRYALLKGWGMPDKENGEFFCLVLVTPIERKKKP